jgi:hypothetical protein
VGVLASRVVEVRGEGVVVVGVQVQPASTTERGRSPIGFMLAGVLQPSWVTHRRVRRRCRHCRRPGVVHRYVPVHMAENEQKMKKMKGERLTLRPKTLAWALGSGAQGLRKKGHTQGNRFPCVWRCCPLDFAHHMYHVISPALVQEARDVLNFPCPIESVQHRILNLN